MLNKAVDSLIRSTVQFGKAKPQAETGLARLFMHYQWLDSVFTDSSPPVDSPEYEECF